MLEYLTSFAVAFAASLCLTYAVRQTARRHNLVAKPRPDRWHSKPTALFGGVAIFLAFAVAVLFSPPKDVPNSTILLLCCAGMFALGTLDDVVNLRPQMKLVGQIAVATCLTTSGLRLFWLPSSVLDQALTVFWLVGITNALNLLDNIDGAAAGVSIIAAAFIAYISHSSGNYPIATLACAFAGAVAGFLVFNFNPASIFMGDSGSLFLGFFLSGVVLLNNQVGARRKLLGVLIAPIMLLLIPILDTALVMLSRMFHGRSIAQGGRDHTSHRLVALGMSERAAALTLCLLSAASGFIAVLAQTIPQAVLALILPMFAATVLLFFVLLGRVKVYEAVREPRDVRGKALLPTLHEFAYKRRVFEVLCDSGVIALAYYGGYLLRFEGAIVQPYYSQIVRTLPLVLIVQLASFLALGLYRGVWKYMSVRDLPTLLRSVLGGWALSVLAVAFVYRLTHISRSALLIDALLLLLLIGGTRALFRWFHVLSTRSQHRTHPATRRALIYGTGDAGVLMARELIENPSYGLVPVGFIDDDPQKHNRNIHGLRVLGSLSRLPRLLQESSDGIDHLVIPADTGDPTTLKEIENACRQYGLTPVRARILLDTPYDAVSGAAE